MNPGLVDFYHSHNVNVITFNYRGFSKSTGKPTMKRIKSDACVVAKWAKL